ncbi:hypothetical protein SLE2022_122890 [Rubroshorea leprosula]
MGGQDSADNPGVRPAVVLTGTAKQGSYGPPIGLIDVGVSHSAYLFRVALPGIRNNQSNIKCEIQRDGRVHIQGVVPDELGLLKGSSTVYQMKLQQRSPPGPFTISFNLPGPVDPRLFSPIFQADGILEVVVMRHRTPSPPIDSVVPPL